MRYQAALRPDSEDSQFYCTFRELTRFAIFAFLAKTVSKLSQNPIHRNPNSSAGVSQNARRLLAVRLSFCNGSRSIGNFKSPGTRERISPLQQVLTHLSPDERDLY